MEQMAAVDDLGVIVGMMRGIIFSISFLYGILGLLAALWWWSRPKCSLCLKRVRIGKGSYHLDAEATKVWMHSSCEELSTAALRVTSEVMSSTPV